MKNETLKITTGGMFVAIFAILLIINRQTGMMLEELIMYILPIPMVAYSAKWGWKTSIPVLIAMGLISIIFGDITTIFYAVTEALVGMVMGSRIHRKAEMTKTLLAVIGLSVICNLLNTVIFASLFGYNLTEEITEMHDMMIQAYQQAYSMSGTDATAIIQNLESLLTPEYLMRVIVISMIALGAIQGVLVYYISLMILNRLHFQLPKPKPLMEYYPPKWSGLLAFLCLGAYIVTYNKVTNENVSNILETAGMCGMLYLAVFGFMGILLLTRQYITKKKVVGVLIGILGYFIMPQIEMLIGLLYITTDWHAASMNNTTGKKGLRL